MNPLLESEFKAKNQFLPWFLASRPKTLPASFPSILMAGAYSYFKTGTFEFSIIFLSLIVLILFQMSVNVLNDALDFKYGADTAQRLGPMRVTASGLIDPKLVLQGGIFLMGLAVLFSVPLMIKGGPFVFFCVSFACVATYGYTGKPFLLAYRGCGELFVFIFFGLIGTCLPYFIINETIDQNLLFLSLQSGLLCSAMMAINNCRDRAEDTLSGKRTLAVRLGLKFAKSEILFLLLVPYILNVYWVNQGMIYPALFSLIGLPLALKVSMGLVQHEPSTLYNKFLGLAAMSYLLFGIGLSVGFLWT